MSCTASRHLTREDWNVVAFYSLVSDQVQNLCPGASEAHFAPQLGVWIRTAEIYGYDGPGLADLIAATRALHAGIMGRGIEPGLTLLIDDDFRDPPEPH